MAVETRDILLKAAEDVTQGMWCRGTWFQDPDDEAQIWSADELFGVSFDKKVGELPLDHAIKSRRCAEGSLALAAKLLGGGFGDYRTAKRAVDRRLELQGHVGSLMAFNDAHLPNDPFEAGQQLAELFRTTAEAL